MAGEAKAEVVDEFDKAFEELAVAAAAEPAKGAADDKSAEGTKTPEEIAAEEAAATKAAADTKAAEDAAAAAAAETPEAKAAREAAEAKAAADAKTAAEAKAAEDARAAAAAKPPEETPEAKAAREAAEAALKPYEPTPEEAQALEQFKKDFPNEYAAVEARLKSVDRDINARVHAAVKGLVDTMTPRLAAVETTAVNAEAERHFAALRTAHPDYDQVIEKVPAWIKTQPAYLQPAMQAVYDQGTTQDVAQLVADFKKASGVVTDPGAAAAAAKAAADEAAAKKRAEEAAALAPVGTRRSAPAQSGTADKSNYDAAWAELEAATK